MFLNSLKFDANIKLAHPYNKVFNPVNLVFLLMSIQSIRLTTSCHIFVKQLMTDFNLLSQSGNNTDLLMLFVIMTGFFLPRQSHFSVWLNLILCSIYAIILIIAVKLILFLSSL